MPARPSLLALAALATLALGSIAAPVAAAGPTTRYVDDDGRAGTAGCAGSRAVPSSIQDAVDASGPGDTILVCPGDYPEQVDIEGAGHKGLSVIAVKKWAARVSPTALAGSLGDTSIIRVAARDVTIQSLKVVARTAAACAQAEFGIKVDGVRGAVIRGNRVVASELGDALFGPCGMVIGIAAYDGSSDAFVAWNLVQNPRIVGILAHDATDVVTSTNSVRYLHPQPICASVACAARAGKAGHPNRAGRATPALTADANGIRYFESTGRILDNAVTGNPVNTIAPYRLEYGISSVNGDGVVIARNRLEAVFQGILVDGLDGGVIRHNHVSGLVTVVSAATRPASLVDVGLSLTNTTGTVVAGNRVTRFGNGIVATPLSINNDIRGNDATGNGNLDCHDASGNTLPAGVPDLIDNTWTDNLGNNDLPVGLCTDLF